MSEKVDPEQHRLSELADLDAGLDRLYQDLERLDDIHGVEDREFARDDILGEIDALRGKLFEKRTFKENSEALMVYIKQHIEEYRELIDMGLPVDEFSVAFDVFQKEEIPDKYLDLAREQLSEMSEE